MINNFDFKVCDIQGRAFEMSVAKRMDSYDFIKKFMKSEVASELDMEYSHMQWAGEEYMMEVLEDIEDIKIGGQVLDKDKMYWIGFIYRYWHYYTGEKSARILKQAPAKEIATSYYMFHTMDPEMAIENLKEIAEQKK